MLNTMTNRFEIRLGDGHAVRLSLIRSRGGYLSKADVVRDLIDKEWRKIIKG